MKVGEKGRRQDNVNSWQFIFPVHPPLCSYPFQHSTNFSRLP